MIHDQKRMEKEQVRKGKIPWRTKKEGDER